MVLVRGIQAGAQIHTSDDGFPSLIERKLLPPSLLNLVAAAALALSVCRSDQSLIDWAMKSLQRFDFSCAARDRFPSSSRSPSTSQRSNLATREPWARSVRWRGNGGGFPPRQPAALITSWGTDGDAGTGEGTGGQVRRERPLRNQNL